nr:MAG TPA: hypothetical protein [Caudoviricetes sp.]
MLDQHPLNQILHLVVYMYQYVQRYQNHINL